MDSQLVSLAWNPATDICLALHLGVSRPLRRVPSASGWIGVAPTSVAIGFIFPASSCRTHDELD